MTETPCGIQFWLDRDKEKVAVTQRMLAKEWCWGCVDNHYMETDDGAWLCRRCGQYYFGWW